MIEESGVEFEGGDPELENGVAPPQPLGEASFEEIDLGEFRRFLDTVSPDEFRAGSEDEN